eukprot:364289-Chlamydomonas_euryale.AAC.5
MPRGPLLSPISESNSWALSSQLLIAFDLLELVWVVQPLPRNHPGGRLLSTLHRRAGCRTPRSAFAGSSAASSV